MAHSILDRVDLDTILADRHLADHLLPEMRSFNWLKPCEIHILLVTDSGGSFGTADFGLSELIDILTLSIGPYARPVISRAHRSAHPGIEFENFRFDAQDLSEFDEIWMFAVSRNSGALTESELQAVSTFMDSGKGVFCTGDHEDLGQAMCGRIPRVRNMRMWHWPNPGPLGEPVAPRVNGPDRHDTLVRRGNDDIVFDDQSDDIPQPIKPKLYKRYAGPFAYAYPHPVLCGPNGPITVMPDHPHEGECYEPSDLSHVFTFGGQQFVEYPTAPDGSQPSPEVISHSTNGPRRATDEKGALNPKTFGGIGVYDGHQASVGRVLVDATWHHFFNINLVGRNGAPPPYDVGFLGSPEGMAAYEEIKAYFRNIAIYLAPPHCQNRMRFLASFWSRWYPGIATEIRLEWLGQQDAHSRIYEFIRLGRFAKDLYGRFASQCQRMIWAWDWLEMVRPLPWSPFMKTRGGPTSRMMMEFEEDLEAALHGAAIYAVALQFPEPLAPKDRDRIDIDGANKETEAFVRKAASEAKDVLAKELSRGRREVARAIQTLK